MTNKKQKKLFTLKSNQNKIWHLVYGTLVLEKWIGGIGKIGCTSCGTLLRATKEKDSSEAFYIVYFKQKH